MLSEDRKFNLKSIFEDQENEISSLKRQVEILTMQNKALIKERARAYEGLTVTMVKK